MKLLANENIPLASVTYLRTSEFDIKAIGVDNASISDREVVNIAILENRTIITHNRDYGELIFKHGLKPNALVFPGGSCTFYRPGPLQAGKI